MADGLVYFGSHDTHFYALDSQTGQAKWCFKTKFRIESSPAVADGVVYFGGDDKYFYAVDSQSGQLLWKFKTRANIYASPVIAAGIVYFGSNDSNLYAIELNGRCPCLRPGYRGQTFALTSRKPLPAAWF